MNANPVRPLHLTVVSAGLSVPSSTRLLADRLTEAVREQLVDTGHDIEVEVVQPRDLAVDIANNLVTGFPSVSLAQAVGAVTSADGLIAVTPVFTASYSGLFKSFFDVIDNDALTGKVVLAAATGGTPRHSLALEHAVRPLFAYLRAIVVPTAVYAASEEWGGSGDPLTDTLPHRIVRVADELAGLMHQRAGSAARAADDTAVVPFAQQLEALRPSCRASQGTGIAANGRPSPFIELLGRVLSRDHLGRIRPDPAHRGTVVQSGRWRTPLLTSVFAGACYLVFRWAGLHVSWCFGRPLGCAAPPVCQEQRPTPLG